MSDAPTRARSATPRFTARPADDPTYDVDPGKGWVLFAGIMLGLVGVLNVIYGIGAISDSRFYVRDVAYVLGDLNTWGWFLTVVGAVQLIASAGVFMNTEWGRWLGIAFAAINGFIQFLVMPALSAVGSDGLHGRRDHRLRPADVRRP